MLMLKLSFIICLPIMSKKFGAARYQRPTHPTSQPGKRKQAWGRIFGGPGSCIGGPSPASTPASSTSGSVMSELSAYLDSTYPILSIMARDVMSVPVSTVSS
jgi:hypothetical protein